MPTAGLIEEQAANDRLSQGHGSIHSLDETTRMSLNLLTILDMVLLVTAARRQMFSSLIGEFGLSEEQAWQQYRRVLRWWSLKVTLAYASVGVIFRLLAEIFEKESTAGFALGVGMTICLVMAAASAVRNIPLRNSITPPRL